MELTKEQQTKVVVEGMALGVLAQGVEEVTADTSIFNRAFDHAWRKWDCADQYPSIGRHVPLPGDLIGNAVARSSRWHNSYATWECAQWNRPSLSDDYFSVEEMLDDFVRMYKATTAQDWLELGRLFLEYFKPEQVHRRS